MLSGNRIETYRNRAFWKLLLCKWNLERRGFTRRSRGELIQMLDEDLE